MIQSTRPHIIKQQRREQWTAEVKRIFSLTIAVGILSITYLVLVGITA